jgi:MFS family permease
VPTRSPDPRRRGGLAAIALVGVAAALAVTTARWSLESDYHSVEIVLDGPDWHALAVAEGLDPDALLREARRRGATSVAVYERTLRRMAAGGEVVYLSSTELAGLARGGAVPAAFAPLMARGLRPGVVYVVAGPEMLGFLEDAFAGLLGSGRVRRAGGILEVAGLREDLEEAGLGLLPQDLAGYRALGLTPVLRLRNYAGLTDGGLRHLFGRLARLGRGFTVLFELNEVLGFERLIDETAAGLRAAGDRYARIEAFSERRKQRGEDRLTQQMRPDVIRLFSLTPEELQVLSPDEAREKFIRSARERNIRLLYVRPLAASAGLAASTVNLDFVGSLTDRLHRFGLQTARGDPLPVLTVHNGVTLVTAAGAVAVLVLALAVLADAIGASASMRWWWALFAGGVLLTLAAFTLGGFVVWRKLLALGVAATVPALAVAALMPAPHPSGASGARPPHPAWQGLRLLWLSSAVAVAAGVVVAGLLSQWEFMLAADGFAGVKVAHVVPVLLVLVLLWRRDRPEQHWRQTLREAWAWSAHPLLLRYAIAAIVVGVAAVVLLGRSGNFGFPLLEVEERLRTLAEQWLVVRPRTKEYLIGHPALMLAAAAAVMGWRGWVLPLAAVGVIGQAGIINSFSHLHTPLLYTVWRTVNALAVGSVLGLAGIWVIAAFAARVESAHPRARRTR